MISPAKPRYRIGIDLGGTKVEGVVLDRDDAELLRNRIPAPRSDYAATIDAIAGLVASLETTLGAGGTVGIGMPGSISPKSGVVQNANSTWLNGRPLNRDLAAALGRDVRLANDANCFALSEFADGAAAGARSLFGVILGTGCGGGLVYDGRIVGGPRSIGGEWGHNPLPSPDDSERPGPLCWCGRYGCMEAWVSGPALAADHERATGERIAAAQLSVRAAAGDAAAAATLDRHVGRLARGLAAVVNVADPELIVIGGGLSNLSGLYTELPRRIAPLVFSDDQQVRVVPPRWGDASGVRGAARLWDES